jgi:glycosyltransferase involved in cell wall biosynthesis
VIQSPPLRVGLVADLLEEGWPSMDLVAEMLLTHVGAADRSFRPVLLRPPLRSRIGRLAGANGRPTTIDRIINRFYDYPRWLRGEARGADVFHLVDHSYAHLVDALPRGRVVVTCHDTDAFRPLIGDGASESRLPRWLVRRVLEGLRLADIVACGSETTRRDLVTLGLVSQERTEVVLYGVHPSCSPLPDPAADQAAAALLGSVRGPELLHVGSTIGRKRIDVLLKVFHALTLVRPDSRLLRVGGAFTPAQTRLAAELGIADRIVVLPFLDRPVLAAVYRRAALVLQPSEREGFGLPLIEAMACGTPVVASDIEVLREVAGDAGSYAAIDDLAAWRATIVDLLDEREARPAEWAARRDRALARASLFSWSKYARQMESLYARLPGAQRPPGASS